MHTEAGPQKSLPQILIPQKNLFQCFRITEGSIVNCSSIVRRYVPISLPLFWACSSPNIFATAKATKAAYESILTIQPTSTILNLTNVWGILKPIRLAINQSINQQKKSVSKTEVLTNKKSRVGLLWWVRNITIYDGRDLIQHPSQALLRTDASMTDWGAFSDGLTTGKTWFRSTNWKLQL